MPPNSSEITAVRLDSPLEANGLPISDAWSRAEPVLFAHDWQGRNADARRSTEVRLLWSDEMLFLRFVCRYRSLTVFEEADSNGRRDRLWERDVAEVFLQPDRFGTRYYKEFEVAPNGFWIDLEIAPEGLKHIASGMRSEGTIDAGRREWVARIAIPMRSLVRNFDPTHTWRANFFRCEGVDPQRFFSAWQPTHTPEPQFHVPERFGTIRFSS